MKWRKGFSDELHLPNLRPSRPHRELVWMVTILTDDDTRVEHYETEGEAMQAGQTAADSEGDGVTVYVSQLLAQNG